MYWNKTIVFEELWPVFLLIAPVRHNKPWRQFENGGTPPRFQTDREKKGETGNVPKYGEVPNMVLSGCLFPSKMAAWELVKVSTQFLSEISMLGWIPVLKICFAARRSFSSWLEVSSCTIIRARCWYLEFTGTILGEMELSDFRNYFLKTLFLTII